MPAKTASKKPTPAKKAAPRRRVAKSVPVAEPRTAPAPVKAHKPTKRTYIFAVGRRKEAIARVRWYLDQQGEIQVNGRDIAKYFPVGEYPALVRSPLVLTHLENQGQFTAKVAGGGSQGQSEAVRLGIARALVKHDADLRIPLKRAGFLRRDPRVKERKKYGLKRARRAPQWQKR